MATQEALAFLNVLLNDANVAEVWKMYEASIAPPPYKPVADASFVWPVFPSVTPSSSTTTIINNNNVVTTTAVTDDDKKKKNKKESFSVGELVGMAVLGAAITGSVYGLASLWKASSEVANKLAVIARARRHVYESLAVVRSSAWEVTEVSTNVFAVLGQVERSLKASDQARVNGRILLTGGVASASFFFIDIFANGGITRSFWGTAGIGSVLATGITWALHNAFGPTDSMAIAQREGIALASYNRICKWRTPIPTAPEEEQRSF